mmetsp:Transcript_3236/g.20088  ORF Transcript_3236/g.20088 Transcript_3236/m.20088 type:complete len:450 (+) Transcript_3236:3644-4993(+)
MVEPFCINSVLQQWLFGVVPSFAIKQFSLLRQSSTNPWAFAIHGSFDKEAFLCLCEHEVLQHVAAFVGQIFARSWDFGHASLSDHRKHSCSFLEVLGCQFDTHFAVSIGLYGLLGDGGSKVEEDGRLFRFDVAQCGFVFSFEGVFPHEKHRADLFLVVAEREPGFHDFEDPMVLLEFFPGLFVPFFPTHDGFSQALHGLEVLFARCGFGFGVVLGHVTLHGFRQVHVRPFLSLHGKHGSRQRAHAASIRRSVHAVDRSTSEIHPLSIFFSLFLSFFGGGRTGEVHVEESQDVWMVPRFFFYLLWLGVDVARRRAWRTSGFSAWNSLRGRFAGPAGGTIARSPVLGIACRRRAPARATTRRARRPTSHLPPLDPSCGSPGTHESTPPTSLLVRTSAGSTLPRATRTTCASASTRIRSRRTSATRAKTGNRRNGTRPTHGNRTAWAVAPAA